MLKYLKKTLKEMKAACDIDNKDIITKMGTALFKNIRHSFSLKASSLAATAISSGLLLTLPITCAAGIILTGLFLVAELSSPLGAELAPALIVTGGTALFSLVGAAIQAVALPFQLAALLFTLPAAAIKSCISTTKTSRTDTNENSKMQISTMQAFKGLGITNNKTATPLPQVTNNKTEDALTKQDDSIVIDINLDDQNIQSALRF